MLLCNDRDLNKNYPRFRTKDIFGINGVGEKQLIHPHFIKWHKWIINEYIPPSKRILVFIPCAAIKPYYNSPIHKEFNKIIDKFPTHKVVITNAGVIPYEFAGCYPFNSYDWNPVYETKNLKKKYIELTKRRISNYLNAHSQKYIGFVAYLNPISESLKALEKVHINRENNIHIVKIDKIKLLPTSDFDLVLIYKKNLERLKKTLEIRRDGIISSKK